MWFKHKKSDVQQELEDTLRKLKEKDAPTLEALASDPSSSLASLSPEERRVKAIETIECSLKAMASERESPDHEYHSRDPLTGLIQSQLQDNVIPELQATGQGNPVVWIPAGVRGVLEHFKQKHPFISATAKSRIEIPSKCKIALLGDWGAPNDHAKRLGELAIGKGADYVIHLGDIYFSGTRSECNEFIRRWPLRDADGQPLKGRSFALNGNHEMYSLGIPYFTQVLSAFGQEASYFTLYNEHWQLQGLDTAYVPFSISGANVDARLQVQWNWLLDSIKQNPAKANIFLSHNQPVSAHLPELEAAQDLMNEARRLLGIVGGTSIYAWFFGHEHRCAIYDDRVESALFRARLIGNGSIPHHPQEETGPEKDRSGAAATPILKVNKRALTEDSSVAVSTFALLTLDGSNIHVDYIDEDDVIFHSEDWNASKALW